MNEIIALKSSPGLVEIIYVALALIGASYLSLKTERFWFSFIILFWLLGQPILHAYFTIRPAWLPFDFQPNRILFLFLCAALPYAHLSGTGGKVYEKSAKSKPPFEKYIIIFIVLVLIAVLLNRNTLDIKRVIAIPLEPLTFFLLYLFIKKVITRKLLTAILYAIIVMAVANALIAIVQLADPLFLRTGNLRPAFGGFYRSYGTFTSEYIFGSFQIVALFVTLTLLKGDRLRYFIAPLLIISIVLTFHRMDLIILLLCSIFYLYKYSSRHVGRIGIFILLFSSIIIIPVYSIFQSYGGESQLVSERLSKDTVSGRLNQFGIVMSTMPRYPLGLGSEDNPVYQELMIKHGHTKSELGEDGRYHDVGLGVHNGFLSVGITYGIAAMIVFTLMLFTMGKYFYRHAGKHNLITVIPLFCVIVWVIANMSNGIIVFRAYNVLTISLLLGAFVGAYQKGIIAHKK